MTAILMIPGNKSTISFANSLTAAVEQLRANSSKSTAQFNKVHVLHTRQSLKTFITSPNVGQWLSESGLHQSDLVHHVVDLNDDPNRRIDELLGDVANITSSRQGCEFYFDLTGGVTQIKVALGILAFIIGATHVYTLEVDFDHTKPEQRGWRLDRLRAEKVPVIYRQISGLEQFDLFGLSNLTSVKRVRTELDELQLSLLNSSLSNRSIEIDHLISLLEQAEAFRLRQEERFRLDSVVDRDERAATRGILFHATAAVEALVDLVICEDPSKDRPTLGPKLRRLREMADARSPHPIDSATLMHLSELLVRLRNRAAHWSDTTPEASVLALQGDLGLRLSKSFIWLITASLESFLNDTGNLVSIRIQEEGSLTDEKWFVGIDGDDTGAFIADVLRDSPDCLDEIKQRSRQIAEAVSEIKDLITKKCGKGSVLFATGDNILFYGKVSAGFVTSLLDAYHERTNLTASAGVGRTPYQASVALKLAKGDGGGTVKVIVLEEEQLERSRGYIQS
ncbi:MAG: mCpol domain-containing protein [Acidobacteria bacterium]|nr:mCpol domain-containing protein [Acidobacteriota bacterium]